ncbi:MAG: hypothetical protein ACYS0I_11135 [Planctomycetota bacterium]
MRLCPLDAMPIPVEISIQQHTDAIISGRIPILDHEAVPLYRQLTIFEEDK